MRSKTPRDQWEAAIQQYLEAAVRCTAPGADYLGYPTTLLLLCTIDAIGNCLLAPKKTKNGRMKSTRLDVLTDPAGPFRLPEPMTDTQVEKLEWWYRNLLAHTGTIMPGGFLTRSDTGRRPFEFDAVGALRAIHVPNLLDLVKDAWARCGKRLDPRTQIGGPSAEFDDSIYNSVSGVPFFKPPGS